MRIFLYQIIPLKYNWVRGCPTFKVFLQSPQCISLSRLTCYFLKTPPENFSLPPVLASVEKLMDLLSLCVYGFCFVFLSGLQHIFTQRQLSVSRKTVGSSFSENWPIDFLPLPFFVFFRLNFNSNQDQEFLCSMVIVVITAVWRRSEFS